MKSDDEEMETGGTEEEPRTPEQILLDL